ncbi:XRE family transcriptional regulator [Colidextribacter sp. OB.20]|nr:XRE family transcriptional regulator [Colidextribacter sp. OB.20]
MCIYLIIPFSPDVIKKNLKGGIYVPIRMLRERMGMTMCELANKMGVSVATVSRWETGEMIPVTARLGALADALHCTADELLCLW